MEAVESAEWRSVCPGGRGAGSLRSARAEGRGPRGGRRTVRDQAHLGSPRRGHEGVGVPVGAQARPARLRRAREAGAGEGDGERRRGGARPVAQAQRHRLGRLRHRRRPVRGGRRCRPVRLRRSHGERLHLLRGRPLLQHRRLHGGAAGGQRPPPHAGFRHSGHTALEMVELRADGRRLAEYGGALLRDAGVRRQPAGLLPPGAHRPAGQPADLGSRCRRLRAVPGLRAPRVRRDLPSLTALPALAEPRLVDRRREPARLRPLHGLGAGRLHPREYRKPGQRHDRQLGNPRRRAVLLRRRRPPAR
ncbi:hypothetical protein SCOCK_30252 [Actinacidiphila cocklensis]|uniref:Uncharacterized protein n=1 Tax=Actinacidiphila cocklensis TaxID=887465 RepID=A0A9W4E844_9ACTN|nr:hypothetical protein SCOCK_30252 [Actinacidiphila cocklensis]